MGCFIGGVGKVYSQIVFESGIVICVIASLAAIVATIVLRLLKIRLNKQLDMEFGRRRH